MKINVEFCISSKSNISVHLKRSEGPLRPQECYATDFKGIISDFEMLPVFTFGTLVFLRNRLLCRWFYICLHFIKKLKMAATTTTKAQQYKLMSSFSLVAHVSQQTWRVQNHCNTGDEKTDDGVTDGYSQRFCAIFGSSTFSSFTLFLMDFFSSKSSSSRRTGSITITQFISTHKQKNAMNNTHFQRQVEPHTHTQTYKSK